MALLLFTILSFVLTSMELQPKQDTLIYDYIVIGCGISGLVVSTRLSEQHDVDVLCLEAGDFDQGEDMITIPHFIGRQPSGFYDWQMKTVSQTHLDGGVRSITVGRGVGGGSLINGMLWNRGNQETYDAWDHLGNPGWSWADLLPYFRKTENFMPKTYANQVMPVTELGTDIHGISGPVQITYPEYYWNQSNNWFEALNASGIPTIADPNKGLSAGGYFLPINLFAATQSRHDARRAYYDPVRNRTNLYIQPNSQVRKIVLQISGEIRATGVQYGSVFGDNRVYTAYARREVILAAGALHTPQILEVSGIGQVSILNSLNISAFINLPGVGNNLQDHALIHLDYKYMEPQLITSTSLDVNATFSEQCANDYHSMHIGPWTAAPLQTVAFLSLRQFASNISQLLLTNTSNPTGFLPGVYGDDLRTGFHLQSDALLASLRNESVPAIEILHDSAGKLDIALQRPFSRGSIHIESADPLLPPLIDPNWLSHPLDFEIMIEAMRLNQQLIQSPPLQALRPSYRSVPRNATQQQMAQILRSGIGTEYHVSGTAAMMPRHLGGVVDTSLRVYGTENLRIVDTSIFPLIPAAHLQAVTFAVAEKAADIIKGVIPGPGKA